MPTTLNTDPPITPNVPVLRLCSPEEIEGDGDGGAGGGEDVDGTGDDCGDGDDGGGGGNGGFKLTISLVTMAGWPWFSRSMTTVEPRTSPEADTAAAARYRRAISFVVRAITVSNPWRGDSAMRFV